MRNLLLFSAVVLASVLFALTAFVTCTYRVGQSVDQTEFDKIKEANKWLSSTIKPGTRFTQSLRPHGGAVTRSSMINTDSWEAEFPISWTGGDFNTASHELFGVSDFIGGIFKNQGIKSGLLIIEAHTNHGLHCGIGPIRHEGATMWSFQASAQANPVQFLFKPETMKLVGERYYSLQEGKKSGKERLVAEVSYTYGGVSGATVHAKAVRFAEGKSKERRYEVDMKTVKGMIYASRMDCYEDDEILSTIELSPR